MSGDRIGGRLEDMFDAEGSLLAAGDEARNNATRSGARVEALRNEVADVTQMLRSDFTTMAEDLDAQIATARRSLESADWDGASRANADAAELAFRNDVTAALAAAMSGVDALEGALLSQVEGFHGEVSGAFTSLMTNIQENYAALARGTRAFAEHIAEGDRLAIRFG